MGSIYIFLAADGEEATALQRKINNSRVFSYGAFSVADYIQITSFVDLTAEKLDNFMCRSEAATYFFCKKSSYDLTADGHCRGASAKNFLTSANLGSTTVKFAPILIILIKQSVFTHVIGKIIEYFSVKELNSQGINMLFIYACRDDGNLRYVFFKLMKNKGVIRIL